MCQDSYLGKMHTPYRQIQIQIHPSISQYNQNFLSNILLPQRKMPILLKYALQLDSHEDVSVWPFLLVKSVHIWFLFVDIVLMVPRISVLHAAITPLNLSSA